MSVRRRNLKSEDLQREYVPHYSGCEIPMDPYLPEGCRAEKGMHYEPYVYRSGKMAEISDTFVPCCKATTCKKDDIACRSKLENDWIARVVRFSDSAQFMSNLITSALGSVVQFTESHKTKLDSFFKEHKDQHEDATLAMQNLIKIGDIIQRDLQKCVNVFITMTEEGDTPVNVAAVMPRGRTFAIMRAEAVASGCGSLERLLAIARREFYPLYVELMDRLTANAGMRRYSDEKKRIAKSYIYNAWSKTLDALNVLYTQVRKLNIATVSFYMLTFVPFLYTFVLTTSVAVPAVLQAKDKLTALSRCMKLFCHFTQIPGLFVGLGIVLTNKINMYFKTKESKEKLNDQVAMGAVTFFTLMEKLIKINPVAAAGIAELGKFKAKGARIISESIQKVADLGDSATVSFMKQTIQGIIMFIMTILSSSIWKAIGMTCKTATKVTAATVQGTAALASGAGTFVSGISYLTSQIYNAAGQTVGYGLGTVGNAADMLGDKVRDFMDIFSDDKTILQNLANEDFKVEGQLENLNDAILKVLGVSSEGLAKGLGDNVVGVLNMAFDPTKVQAVEKLFRNAATEYKVEFQIVFFVWAVAYGTWSFFQPIDDSAFDKTLSAIFKESQTEIDDWRVQSETDYALKFNRIIPRPPPEFVYQQCLREDSNRHDLCLKRVKDWSGLDYTDELEESEQPPAYSASSPSRRRRNSARSPPKRSGKSASPS